MNVRTGNTFAQAATACNLSSWSFVLTFDHSGLSQDDFSWKLYFWILLHTFNCHSHMINDHTFFSWCNVTERSWPSFKCFETEWKTVLTRGKTVALINLRSVLCKHVSCLEIRTLKISIVWCPDISRTMIVFPVVFWLRIGDNDRCLF